MRSVYKLTMLLVTFGLWFIVSSCAYDTLQLNHISAIAAHVRIEVAEAATNAYHWATLLFVWLRLCLDKQQARSQRRCLFVATHPFPSGGGTA